jgi:KDO2-lipid IV(A) lauroyltransferase
MAARRRPADEGRALQLVYYAFVAASAVAKWMPERMIYRAAEVLGSWAATFAKKRKRVVERNLSRVTGLPPDSEEVQRLTEEAFRSYARYWLETFRLVREDREFFRDRFRSETEENVWSRVKDGRGVIVVVGHLGNWDAAGAWVGASGHRLVTVVEVLRPRRMFDFFADHRAKLGMTIYGAEKGVTTKLREEAEKGAVVAILGDRDLKGTGPLVTFFGEEIPFPAGAASIGLSANIPILVGGVFEKILPDGRRGWEAIITGEVEPPPEGDDRVEVMTQRIATQLEEFVRMHPEQWHAVFQKMWPSDRVS